MEHKRQLAAILFADIVGYTGLMEKSEASARVGLQKFRSVLNEKVAAFDGRVINFYGDGCLCVFDSSVNAMDCAGEVQRDFQTDPVVPVRIGLHSGDVFFEEDNVYGDSVNITSRIESMGMAGSVLFSKRMKRDNRNQEGLEIVSLGEFEFKNVDKTMEVFALANEGLTVPRKEEMKGKLKALPPEKKKVKWLVPALLGLLLIIAFGIWQTNDNSSTSGTSPLSEVLREKRVIVMVFENQTMNSSLDVFGKMISDWITKGLIETGEANVISAANIQQHILKAGAGNAASSELASSTGVGVVLQGRYYLQEGQLIIHSNIVDAEKGQVIYALDPIKGQKDDMMALLEELTQKVLGYWVVKDQISFSQNPPKYEAYLAYEKGASYHGVDFEQSVAHLKKAYELDTTFNAPLLKLIAVYSNQFDRTKVDSILTFVETKQSSFTEWEKLRFEYLKAGQNRQWLKAAQLAEKRYRMDQSDYIANYNAGLRYNNAGYPQKAVDIFNEFDLRFMDPDDPVTWRGGPLSGAYFKLGEYEEIVKLAVAYNRPVFFNRLAINHLKALIHLDSFDLLAQQLKTYSQKEVVDARGRATEMDNYLRAICEELYIRGEEELLLKYAEDLKNWTEQHPKDPTDWRSLGLAAWYVKDYRQAIAYWEKIEERKNNIWGGSGLMRNLSRIGICYAQAGDTEAAQSYMDKILAVESENREATAGRYYFLARIQAALSQQEEAMTSLHKFAEERSGYPYVNKNDGFLKPLFGYPAFEELAKPKG